VPESFGTAVRLEPMITLKLALVDGD